MNVPGLGVRETRDVLGRRERTVVEHVEATLAAIRERDAALGAFVSVAGESALRQAEAADQLVRQFGPAAWEARPLLGVTVSVKDLVQTEDLPTRRGSLLDNPRPRQDAPA